MANKDSDPFSILGVSPNSSANVIRSAWKDLARSHHPDVGGDVASMQRINQALIDALAMSDKPDTAPSISSVLQRDTSSFTVSVLPVECFLALEVVAAICGPTVHDDAPYVLEFHLHDAPIQHALYGWCRCELVPEAGSTTIHLTVGSDNHKQSPSVEEVRDYLVLQLNEIDWPKS
jgi:hypothetical protein